MSYQARKIVFNELFKINGWTIKIYTISKTDKFEHPAFYKNVKAKIPEWLKMENSFDSRNDKIGFLILHEATEGIFSLLNWWVGKNMLNAHVFFTRTNETDSFRKISGDGLLACVWELEVINYERVSWLNNTLRKMPNPDYKSYLNDVINTTI